MNKHNNEEEVVLGQNVTEYARAKASKGTAVISVRLSTDDIARLETIGRASGKTVSQVVRDALAAYDLMGHHLILHLWNGSLVGSGAPRFISRGGWPDAIKMRDEESEVWEMVASSSGTAVL